MAAHTLNPGYAGNAPVVRRHRYQDVVALTLLELLVVMFIIAVMLGLVLPAVQAARSKAQSAACQNNVRQLGVALQRYMETTNKDPELDGWTINVLKWIEELSLADEIANGIRENSELPRPPLFRCPAQPDIQSCVANADVCHYVLVIDRPPPGSTKRSPGWDVQDRERLDENQIYDPWYRAPEITIAKQKEFVSAKHGPHPIGVFHNPQGVVPDIR